MEIRNTIVLVSLRKRKLQKSKDILKQFSLHGQEFKGAPNHLYVVRYETRSDQNNDGFHLYLIPLETLPTEDYERLYGWDNRPDQFENARKIWKSLNNNTQQHNKIQKMKIPVLSLNNFPGGKVAVFDFDEKPKNPSSTVTCVIS